MEDFGRRAFIIIILVVVVVVIIVIVNQLRQTRGVTVYVYRVDSETSCWLTIWTVADLGRDEDDVCIWVVASKTSGKEKERTVRR